MAIKSLFTGHPQQIWCNQLCSLININYFRIAAEHRLIVSQTQDLKPEVLHRLPQYVFLLFVTQNTLRSEINWLLKFKDLCLESLRVTFLSNLCEV